MYLVMVSQRGVYSTAVNYKLYAGYTTLEEAKAVVVYLRKNQPHNTVVLLHANAVEI